MQIQIQKGTPVWLKSGGPKMTVKEEHNPGEWICSWFNKKDEFNQQIFTLEQLTTEDPNVLYLGSI